MSHTELHPLRGGLAIAGGLVVGLGSDSRSATCRRTG